MTPMLKMSMTAVVLLALLDLGSHVGHGAAVGLQLVDLLERPEAEISNLQVQVLVDQDVFELQIAVDDRLALEIVERVKHLTEEVPASVLAHAAECLTEVEEQAAWDVLKHDVDEVLDLAARGLLHMAFRAVAEDVDDVLVLEALENLDFLLDSLDGLFVPGEELIAQQLESHHLLRVGEGAAQV